MEKLIASEVVSMWANNCVVRQGLLTCLSVLVLTSIQTVAQTQTTKGNHPNDTSVRCKQVRSSSKRKVPGSLLCGPPKKISNAETALGPDTVELRVLIDENGKATSVKPILGNPAFYEAAVKAVNKMKFTPKRISGRAVKTELNLRVVVDAAPK